LFGRLATAIAGERMALLETALLLRATHKILYRGDQIDFIGIQNNIGAIFIWTFWYVLRRPSTQTKNGARIIFAPSQQRTIAAHFLLMLVR
jgi:hypothetical protein